MVFDSFCFSFNKNKFKMKYSPILVLFLLTFFASPCFSQSFSCYAPTDDLYWKIGSQYGSKRLSECSLSADYNCHGFAMAFFEVPCAAPSWNFPGPNPYICPTLTHSLTTFPDYKTDNRYIRVCNEADSKLVFYKTTNANGEDHSAVRDQSINFAPFKYISKYGKDGPLVAHNLHGSFYHLSGNVDVSQTEFWTYVGPIATSNPTIPLQIGVTKSFAVQQASGVTYTWTSIYGKFNISSGQGTNVVVINPVYSGNDILRLNVSSGNCGTGSTKVQEFPITISPKCMDGTYSLGSTSNISMNSVNFIGTGQVITKITCPSAATITWVKTSGNLIFTPWNITNVLFNMTSGGSISFTATALDASNQIIQTRNISFYNMSSFSAYPNPSSDEISLDLPQELEFEVMLVDLRNGIKYGFPMNLGSDRKIDLSSIPNGEYSVIVSFEGKVVAEKKIILERK
jgi:hypothetical protein